MFEGKLPKPAGLHADSTGTVTPDALCELQWSDLVTRLAAARELRAELARGDESCAASFDADSAKHIAAMPDGLRCKEERAVNPDGLVNGKDAVAERVFHENGMTPALRGNT